MLQAAAALPPNNLGKKRKAGGIQQVQVMTQHDIMVDSNGQPVETAQTQEAVSAAVLAQAQAQAQIQATNAAMNSAPPSNLKPNIQLKRQPTKKNSDPKIT